MLFRSLDALYLTTQHRATTALALTLFSILNLHLSANTLPILSYHTTRLTLLTSLPALLTGVIELAPLLQRDGISTRKAQTGVLHALVNYGNVAGAAYNWWTRSKIPGFVPRTGNVVVSALLAVPSMAFAAFLGGQLVYRYGMGVGRGDGGKGKKRV